MTIVVDTDAPADPARLEAVAAHALRVLGVPQEAALTVTLTGMGRIAELKEQAFGSHEATDVLSFPIDDPFDPAPGPIVLGDIVICVPVATRQARALGRTVDDEMAHLLVHGILHLLGRDHDTAARERAMAREEQMVLAGVAA